jgi:hypothetical protein
MRSFTRASSGLALLLAIAGGLSAQESEPAEGLEDPEAAATRAILERQGSVGPDGFTEDQRSHLLNKVKVAEETHARLRSLEEAGNPHIQQGPTLLLPGFQRSPEAAQVDLAELRERTIARIERRPPASRPPASAPSVAQPEAAPAPPAPPAPTLAPPPAPRGKGVAQLVVVVLGLGAAIAGALWILRK